MQSLESNSGADFQWPCTKKKRNFLLPEFQLYRLLYVLYGKECNHRVATVVNFSQESHENRP